MGYADVLATNLRVQRAKKRVRQQDVADAVSIDQAALSQYENGTRVPNVETVVKLADYYGISLDTLAGRTKATG
ncbi:MAG: helix-turn-helix transcriptional regulator [Coriobacteriaceae bacterium]|uniref:helix-turn-helix domain-containing protein n=1 Tax=Parafannyhessea umbonata TaxID=604330 RepID=UPI0026F0E7B8|nr:helix-turn-helix transcriptional regulator [Parafannyhessea umbonata]MCI6844814.1 helix-turn-helix transcriptional regulator [Coriobacteriaceae bacterium]MCI7439032.1 helix-turn-helix transcriptional regulator [Coriobacteriaceae bacterium]MDD6566435.1 helix-turn-helix transcriptional regulator [Parafannyhessea umbonata]